MELKDFVSQTLIEIVQGVCSAQINVRSMGASVSPRMKLIKKDNPSWIGITNEPFGWDSAVLPVEFDVALTVTKGKGSQSGIGVVLGAVGIGGRRESKNSDERENRVKFVIPLSLPPQTHPRKTR
jgi:hypothetical protein